jgi:hypothetical protein
MTLSECIFIYIVRWLKRFGRFWGSPWGHFEIIVWSLLGTFGSRWGDVRVTLGSLWGDIGVTLGSFLGHFGDHFGVTFGTPWGSLWNHFEITFRVFVSKK